MTIFFLVPLLVFFYHVYVTMPITPENSKIQQQSPRRSLRLVFKREGWQIMEAAKTLILLSKGMTEDDADTQFA